MSDGAAGRGPDLPPSDEKGRQVLVEICVTSVEDALAAQAGGADRVEVCSGLVEGGTTPSLGLLGAVLEAVDHIAVHVLVRPRGGDFLYTEAEVEVMLGDIEAFLALARQRKRSVGFVVGALRPDGSVDEPTTGRLVAACGASPVTFHRAFDFTSDLRRSLDVLGALGLRRVLSAGGSRRALDGAGALADLVRRAGPGLGIIAAGAVRAANVAEVVRRTGVREVHLRTAHDVDSAMLYRAADLSLSSPTPPRDYVVPATSAEDVSAVCRALSGLEAR